MSFGYVAINKTLCDSPLCPLLLMTILTNAWLRIPVSYYVTISMGGHTMCYFITASKVAWPKLLIYLNHVGGNIDSFERRRAGVRSTEIWSNFLLNKYIT
jgi:hypothetical protein